MTSSAYSSGPSRIGQFNLRATRKREIDDLIPDDELGTSAESPRKIALRKLRGNRTAHVSLAIFLGIVVLCASAGFLEQRWAGRTYDQQNLSGKTQISGKKVEIVNLRGTPTVGPGVRKEYTLGADALGRDVFMRTLRGGWTSLRIGFGAMALTVLIGVTLGTISGYRRGKIDAFISHIFDTMLAMPYILLATSLSVALATASFGPIKRGSLTLTLLIIGVLGGFYFGRIVRSSVLSLAEREFVEAARALGGSDKRIIVRHIIPHLSTTIITYSGVLIGGAMIAEAALSFLGIGVLPPTASWGNMIADGRYFYATAWWISFFPGLCIAVTVLTLNLLGQALEEALDPKMLGGK
jgi:peptide/nickel transport system permease protein